MMPHSRVLAHDDALDVHLGGRQEHSRSPRLPLVRASSAPRSTALKAIVKVGYFRAGRVPGYLQYIERDGTAGPVARDGTTAAQGYSGYIGRDGAGEGGQRAELFTREGQAVDREAFVNRGRGDPRAWTIIISPGSNDLDMARYVREFMLQMELDLGNGLIGLPPSTAIRSLRIAMCCCGVQTVRAEHFACLATTSVKGSGFGRRRLLSFTGSWDAPWIAMLYRGGRLMSPT